MIADTALYRDLAYVFLFAVVGGLVARRLGQPLIVGYVLGGIIIGPFTPGIVVDEIHILELFAEIGVIFLMYSIGIEFSLEDLLHVKWVALIGGPIGIFASIALGFAVGRLMGWSILQSIAIGSVVSLASTMVLSSLLIDRGELQSLQGRAMIGITLVDDLVFVFLIVLLPALANVSQSRLLGIGLAFGTALLILVPLVLVAAKLVPPLMGRLARIQNQELYLLVVLAVGFLAAAATEALGLSLALGAFLAGMLVSGTENARQTLAHLLPFRNAFAALFFVTIGALMNPVALLSNPTLLGVIVLMIVLGKFIIWTTVVWLFRYPIQIAILVAVGLTQVGEFSYVLVQVSRDAGLVGAEVYSATLGASLITILLNAVLMRKVPQWLKLSSPAK